MNEIENGHEILPQNRMTENVKKAGPETGQRDERNRNGHEILPKSRMTENVKKAGPQTGQRDERNRNVHEILPKSRMTENVKKAGPETGQRDERTRNGHEILPKSRMRRMPKRFEHQLLRSKPDREWAREHAVDIPKGAEQVKCPEGEEQVFRELNSRYER